MPDDISKENKSQGLHIRNIVRYLHGKSILGWCPIYLENRVNASMVLYEEIGQECFVRSAQQIYRDHARFHCLDLRELRDAFADAVGKTQYLPLLLPDIQKVYSPLKCRLHPYDRNDGATGYFNPRLVDHLKACRDDTTDIYFTGGHIVNVYMTSSRVKERFKESMRFQDLFAYRHGNLKPE